MLNESTHSSGFPPDQEIGMDDLYYLRSILMNLRELAQIVDAPSIGSEILQDNIDWLDCYIDSLKEDKNDSAA